jgi:hypothetical protein
MEAFSSTTSRVRLLRFQPRSGSSCCSLSSQPSSRQLGRALNKSPTELVKPRVLSGQTNVSCTKDSPRPTYVEQRSNELRTLLASSMRCRRDRDLSCFRKHRIDVTRTTRTRALTGTTAPRLSAATMIKTMHAARCSRISLYHSEEPQLALTLLLRIPRRLPSPPQLPEIERLLRR